MTVIKPNKNKSTALFIAKLLALLVGASLLYVYYYNGIAGYRYEIGRLKAKMKALSDESAELERSLYEATSPSRLESFAKASGLVLEYNPEYLTLPPGKESSFVGNQRVSWVSDLSF